MDPSWKALLQSDFTKPYFASLIEFVREERKTHIVFPSPEDTFNAFKVTPYERANVLILGQDPYHNAGQAHGLSFSVRPGIKPPPSLVNVFKELNADLGVPIPKSGHLEPWGQQGVFLLNSTLTVRAHEPGSHQGRGWEEFTDNVISHLNARPDPVVFVLWGRYARAKRELIDAKHVVIESAHPSPMSASNGFFGSRPFSKVNVALERFGKEPIYWRL